MTGESHGDVYGLHTTLRLDDIKKVDALDDPTGLGAFIVRLVARIDMHILAGPLVASEMGEPARRGHSGVAILVESHIALHAYPELRVLFLEVFSCKPYPVGAVLDTCREEFGTFEVVEQQRFERGRHWSTKIECELANWTQRSVHSAASLHVARD